VEVIKLSSERQAARDAEFNRYFSKAFLYTGIFSSEDIETALKLIKTQYGYKDIYEKFFLGKDWRYPELERWKKHGQETGEWIRCFAEGSLRHDFTKDDVSDFFGCVSTYRAKKELLAVGAFYPKRNIKTEILKKAEEDPEYRKLLTKILKDRYYECAYKILWETTSIRASNSWKKKDAIRIFGKDVNYYWKGVITTETDTRISRNIEKEHPDAIFPVIPCEAYDWQFMLKITPRYSKN
jgi:hypothetical protein